MRTHTPGRRSVLMIALVSALPFLGACNSQTQAVATPIPPAAPSPAASPASSPVVVPASSPQPTQESGQTHTVGDGDTLRSMAKEFYGDGDLWQKIFEANKDTIGADPDNIKIGQTLKIPPKE